MRKKANINSNNNLLLMILFSSSKSKGKEVYHSSLANYNLLQLIIFLGSKITADGDCSHEIKRHLLLGRKVMTNLDSILKSRDNSLPTKVRLVKAVVFPMGMYGCESWTVKKAERQKSDAFQLWCWRRLKSPLDCKEIQPVHPKGDKCWVFTGRTDAEADSNTLATSCEELTHWKRP